VGLCQVGAFGMAQSGSTFDRIVRHYYSGVAVDRRY
jgi:stage II sporulation protein D